MPDAFGLRAVFSVLLLGTNALVEPDMASLRAPDVTNQSYRFPFPSLLDTVGDLIELIEPTLDMALAFDPDLLVIAYSPGYMADGVNAVSQLRRFFDVRVDIPVTLASDAVPASLKSLEVTRVGIVTPFQSEANLNVSSFFFCLWCFGG